jgi:hypothetical protein
MPRAVAVAVAGLALAIAVTLLLPREAQHLAPPAGTRGAPPHVASPAHPEIGFHSRERLIEHFRKHGRDFDARDAESYLRLAQSLRDRGAGGDVIEAVRADGVICRFDRARGAFLAYDRDLTIRTFFKPNDGEAYFRRQLGREHGDR